MKRTILTVRGLDSTVIERLKDRAHRHSHSLEAELREILSEAVRWPPFLDPLAEADRIAAMTPAPLRRIEPFEGGFAGVGR